MYIYGYDNKCIIGTYKLVWNEINVKELVPAQLSTRMEMSLSFHSHLQTRTLFSPTRLSVRSAIAVLHE